MLLKYIRFFLKDYLFTLFSIIFVIMYWVSAHKLPIGAIQYAIFITFIVAFFIVWNIIMSVIEFKKVFHSDEDDRKKYNLSFGMDKPKLITIGTTLLYVILIPILGYAVSTFIYLGFLGWFLGIKNPIRIIVYSSAITFILFAVFKLWLQARLPSGLFI